MVKSTFHGSIKEYKHALKAERESATALKKQIFKKTAKKEYIWKSKIQGQHYQPISITALQESTLNSLQCSDDFKCSSINPDVWYKKTSPCTIMTINWATNLELEFKRFEKSIFDHKSPRKTLSESAFLEEYDKFDRNSITKDMIWDILPSKLQLKMNVVIGNSIEQICVRLWSLGSETSGLYKKMNKALYEDDRKKIKKYMPIISGLNQYLVHEVQETMVTWRGSKMTTTQFLAFDIGKIYRCPAIAATSLNKDVAVEFKDRYMFKFVIPFGTWNAAEISPHSDYKAEKEVLFPAYSAFKVVNRVENTICAEVLDNKEVSLNVPSVFI